MTAPRCAAISLFVLTLRPLAITEAAQVPTALLRSGTCYDLLLGPWHPPLRLGADSLEIAPPSRIRLDTTRGQDFGDGFLITTPSVAMPSKHRFAFWKPVGQDSLAMSWSTGFSGFSLRARITPDGLRGRAETFWDFSRTIQGPMW